jgi:hypothetical protein
LQETLEDLERQRDAAIEAKRETQSQVSATRQEMLAEKLKHEEAMNEMEKEWIAQLQDAEKSLEEALLAKVRTPLLAFRSIRHERMLT